jgi:RNA polymerase-associated protein
MMTLYSGITDPFSHRCRIVLYEKGMDFEIIDVDLMNKPEDLAVMNPYNRTPVLVERDLVLYESNIINEYIDERFPHPQLMPADPVMRARRGSSCSASSRSYSTTCRRWNRARRRPRRRRGSTSART